jgi:hypothetical protein
MFHLYLFTNLDLTLLQKVSSHFAMVSTKDGIDMFDWFGAY